jgi:hypothetical protein
MAKRECVSTYFDLPRGPSKQSRFAKDEALLARYDDLFAVPENKDEACATKAACLFHVAEVDDAITRGSEEGGTAQPALAVCEGAPDESRTLAEMEARMFPASFKKGNVCNPNYPTFIFVVD